MTLCHDVRCSRRAICGMRLRRSCWTRPQLLLGVRPHPHFSLVHARALFRSIIPGLAICISCGTARESRVVAQADSTTGGPTSARIRDEPAVAVERFYRLHFAAGQGFSLATLRTRQAWFTPRLYDLLLADMGHPEEGIGYVESDPFVDGQEEAARFDVGPSRQAHDTAVVDVVVTYPQDVGNGHEMRQVSVALLPSHAGWQIADLVYSHRSLASGLAGTTRH